MKTSKDTEKIIKLLQLFDNFTPNDFLKKIRQFSLVEKMLEVSNIPISEGIFALQKLIENKYIKKLTEKEFEKITKALGEALLKKAEEEIEEGKYLAEQMTSLSKENLYSNGIDIKKVKTYPDDMKISEVILDNKEIKTNNLQEEFIKSKVIAHLYFEKDIFTLLDMLEKGIDYNDIDHENFPPKLSFNKETSILSIHNIGTIQIAKNPKRPNKSHYLLEYIFEKGIGDTHQYFFMHKDGLFSKHSENFEEVKNIYKRYKNPAEYINKKIKEKYNIENFLKITTKSVSINYPA